MRKLLTLVLMLASFGFVGFWSNTNTATAAGRTNPQVQIEIGRRRHRFDRDRRFGYRTETRIVHEGWRTYRETYQVRYLPDGRTQWVLVDRERIYQ